ncbi:MAG: hypothetical protein NVS9B9_28520 [Ktedonobacteraceae bacterium]
MYETRRAIDGEKAMVVAVVSYPQSTPAAEYSRPDIGTAPMEDNWIVGVTHLSVGLAGYFPRIPYFELVSTKTR